ncbi:hypothetical protein HS088_TW23G00890 [Tripterygium wilfordii]|uniref:DUF3511 domain protein n=1 Tax=Tripterygium wilfordii TaxID=458696 RepID=A0A7J7BW88_TRIWF|nr:uncharacterized protein LOC119992796 [Tripterygium wilfordii]XP_038695514.1 uncharacterized protein LOC119992796 [Tripterygium wilfordii]KAF5726149.1 hypothetical protein HS088_TW23G00890 [Tripterygium wilfordii]
MEKDYNRRSSSYGNGGMMQMESYYGPPPRQPISYDFRSYSASYAQTQMGNNSNNFGYNNRELKLKKGKSTSGSSSSNWSFTDPEFQRKKRVASYKMYSAEGKVKGSFRKSFRWLKEKYTRTVYGWW